MRTRPHDASPPYAGWTALSVVLLALGVSAAKIASAQRVPTARDPGQAVRVYEGVSNTGEFQQALDRAVAAAMRALPGADRMVRYRVRDITGEQGGIRGVNTLRVTIEVTGDDGRGAEGRPAEERPIEGPVVGDGARPAEDNEADLIRKSLRPVLTLSRARVARGETVSIDLTLKNTGSQTLRVPFATGQKYDFEVLRGDRVVWRWSQGRMFTQALSSVALGPGATVTYRENWNTRTAGGALAPSGEYTVRGFLRTSTPGLRVGDTAMLLVTAR